MKNRKEKNIFNFFNKSSVTFIPNLYKDPTTEKLWNNISEEHKHKNSQLSTCQIAFKIPTLSTKIKLALS